MACLKPSLGARLHSNFVVALCAPVVRSFPVACPRGCSLCAIHNGTFMLNAGAPEIVFQDGVAVGVLADFEGTRRVCRRSVACWLLAVGCGCGCGCGYVRCPHAICLI